VHISPQIAHLPCARHLSVMPQGKTGIHPGGTDASSKAEHRTRRSIGEQKRHGLARHSQAPWDEPRVLDEPRDAMGPDAAIRAASRGWRGHDTESQGRRWDGHDSASSKSMVEKTVVGGQTVSDLFSLAPLRETVGEGMRPANGASVFSGHPDR
jgi:hypothetical protein